MSHVVGETEGEGWGCVVYLFSLAGGEAERVMDTQVMCILRLLLLITKTC